MARYPSPVLSILAAALIAITISLAAAANTTRSPPPPQHTQEEQLDNIIDALIGAGDFGNWADLLSAADPADFPFSATLFVPANSAASAAAEPRNSILNPFVFAYHIVPQRLSFSDLLLFKNHARLPTLLPNKSILITRNSSTNFTLDGTRLTHPDLYTSDSVAVHAVASVLDYKLYGDPSALLPKKPSPLPPIPQPLPVSDDTAVSESPEISVTDPPVIAIYDDIVNGAPAHSPLVPVMTACAVLLAF